MKNLSHQILDKMAQLILFFIFLLSINTAEASEEWDKIRFRNLPSGKYEISSGTGFFVSDNYIATNYHVIEKCTNYSARGAIDPSPLELIAYDKNVDLAILKSYNSPKYLPIITRNKTSPKPDNIYAIGYPKNSGETGIFQLIPVQITKYNNKNPREMIEFTISSVDHGNSGGPLIDSEGKILGIVQGKITRYINQKIVDKQGLAIKTEILETMLQKLQIPYYVTTDNNLPTLEHPELAKNFIVNIHCVKIN